MFSDLLWNEHAELLGFYTIQRWQKTHRIHQCMQTNRDYIRVDERSHLAFVQLCCHCRGLHSHQLTVSPKFVRLNESPKVGSKTKAIGQFLPSFIDPYPLLIAPMHRTFITRKTVCRSVIVVCIYDDRLRKSNCLGHVCFAFSDTKFLVLLSFLD